MHTPIKLMTEMLQIHSEVEKLKHKEMEKEIQKHDRPSSRTF